MAQNRIVSNGRMVKQLEKIGGKTGWPGNNIVAQIKEMNPHDTLRAAF